jgi:YHS domain-containing protein
MTVFRPRPAAAFCLLTGTVASISLAGLVWAQAPAENWPFDEHNQAPAAQPAAQPKSAVQQRLEELYRRDGRPLPEYMQPDASSGQAAPATPSQPSAETSAQRNQRGGAAPQGTVHQQLSDYYQSQGRAIPAPQRAAGSASANSTQNARAQSGQASATQPAPGHWYDRINPFHKSTPAPEPHSQAQSSSPVSTAAKDVNYSAPVQSAPVQSAPVQYSAPVQHEAAPVNRPSVTVAVQPSASGTSAPAAKPNSFWGDLTLRRVPQAPAQSQQSQAPLWVELGPSGKLVKKDKVQAPVAPAAVAQKAPQSAHVAVMAPGDVAPAVVAVPAEPQPGPPATQKVAAANVVSEADDPTMPFHASSEVEADQSANGPYTGLTLEDEQNQLVPPKVETPKVVTPAAPAPRPAIAADAHHAEPANIAHASSQPVDSQKQTDQRVSDEPGHVSYPRSEDPGHGSASQNDVTGHVSAPPTEESGHVSLPQSAESEPTGPTLPQPQSRPQAVEVAKQCARHQQTPAEKQRLIGERAGQRGLKGFCPVVLRDQRELADVNPGYCSVYHGQRYCFSSSEAQARFDAAPHKYAPAAGGVDVVVKANSDQALEGSLDFALWYKDRLYLFCSPESLHAFSMNPTAYAAAAQRMQ